MSAYSRDDLQVELADESIGEFRSVDAGGFTMAIERIKAGIDTRPVFKGLPNGECQSPHWGYLISGRLRVIDAGGEWVVGPGQVYYLAPGHNLVVEEDCEVVELSPAEERRKTLEHAEKAMAQLA
jgi:hypothetical protein